MALLPFYLRLPERKFKLIDVKRQFYAFFIPQDFISFKINGICRNAIIQSKLHKSVLCRCTFRNTVLLLPVDFIILIRKPYGINEYWYFILIGIAVLFNYINYRQRNIVQCILGYIRFHYINGIALLVSCNKPSEFVYNMPSGCSY